MTEEQKQEQARKAVAGNAKFTAKQRSEIKRKAWETRRKNAAESSE